MDPSSLNLTQALAPALWMRSSARPSPYEALDEPRPGRGRGARTHDLGADLLVHERRVSRVGSHGTVRVGVRQVLLGLLEEALLEGGDMERGRAERRQDAEGTREAG